VISYRHAPVLTVPSCRLLFGISSSLLVCVSSSSFSSLPSVSVPLVWNYRSSFAVSSILPSSFSAYACTMANTVVILFFSLLWAGGYALERLLAMLDFVSPCGSGYAPPWHYLSANASRTITLLSVCSLGTSSSVFICRTLVRYFASLVSLIDFSFVLVDTIPTPFLSLPRFCRARLFSPFTLLLLLSAFLQLLHSLHTTLVIPSGLSLYARFSVASCFRSCLPHGIGNRSSGPVAKKKNPNHNTYLSNRLSSLSCS